MPSPGIESIKQILGTTKITVNGFNTGFNKQGEVIVRLATATHNGWGSLYPTTVSTVEESIITEFTGYIKSGWEGFEYIKCLGRGIDIEIQSWVNSWDTNTSTHTYNPSSGSIFNQILSCIHAIPIIYHHTHPLPQALADAWMNGFVQEGG